MISSCSGTLATFQDNTIHFDSLLPGCRSYQPPLHVCLLQNQITTSAPISAANNLMTLVILSIATQPPNSKTNWLAPHTITQLFFNWTHTELFTNSVLAKKVDSFLLPEWSFFVGWTPSPSLYFCYLFQRKSSSFLTMSSSKKSSSTELKWVILFYKWIHP